MSLTRIIVFLSIVSGLSSALHYYIWVRVIRDTSLPDAGRSWGTVVVIALAVLLPVTMLSSRFLPRSISSPLVWVAMTWLGLLFFTVVSLFVGDLLRVASFAARLGSPLDPSRRTLIARVLSGAAVLVASGLGIAGVASVLGKVALRDVRVGLKKFPETLSGYVIVQMTDIHIGPTIGRGFIEQLVAQANSLNPDMIVITGDLVDGSVDELRQHAEPLKNLKAIDGVFFVTGNHEYYSGVDAWIAYLTSLGIRVLRNEHVSIRDAFHLAGIDDHRAKDFGNGHGADIKKALLGRDTTKAVVLLAHQPKQAIEAAEHGVDLQLSGHTHGGQLFPFNYLVGLDQPYVAGLHSRKEMQIYVSRGTGYWGPPMRVGAPAEVTRITIESV